MVIADFAEELFRNLHILARLSITVFGELPWPLNGVASVNHRSSAQIGFATTPNESAPPTGRGCDGRLASQLVALLLAVSSGADVADVPTKREARVLVLPPIRRRHCHRRGLEAFGPRGEPRR